MHFQPLYALISTQQQIGVKADKKHVALLNHQLLPLRMKLPRPPRHHHNPGPLQPRNVLLGAALQVRGQDVEVARRRGVDARVGLEARGAELGVQARVLGVVEVEGQAGGEEVDGVAVCARAGAGVEHVVRARHALEEVAGQVRVDAVGGDVEGLALLEGQEVHGQHGDEAAGLGGAVLVGDAREERADVGLVAELGHGGFEEGLVDFGGLRLG